MATKPQIIIFENSHTLTNYLLKRWMEIVQQSVDDQGLFRVALSGGTSPIEFYCRLSGFKDFDLWQKTHVFSADERLVPFDAKENNFRMITDNLLSYVNIPKENLHPVVTTHKNVSEAADEYAAELIAHFKLKPGQLPHFDLIMLGIGEDGHTASLFPHDAAVEEKERLVFGVSANHLKNERITLTLPVINQARHIIFLVTGAQKAGVVKSIIEDNLDCPARHVKPQEGEVTFLLDKGAAGQLPYLDSYKHFGEGIIYELPRETTLNGT